MNTYMPTAVKFIIVRIIIAFIQQKGSKRTTEWKKNTFYKQSGVFALYSNTEE